MLVNYKVFEGFLSIASVETPPVLSKVNLFINQREPEILGDIFGHMYKEYLSKIDIENMPTFQIIGGSIPDKKGVFVVDNAEELSSIIQREFSFIVQSLSDITIRSKPFLNSPKLADYIRSSKIESNGDVWMYYDCMEGQNSLGKVFINSLFECKIEYPALWGVVDSDVSFSDLISITGAKNALISEYGFLHEYKGSISRVYEATFGPDYFFFMDPDFAIWARDIAARFVWYWYSRDLNSLMANSGTARTKTENAHQVDPAQKQAEVWNDMHDLIFSSGKNRTGCPISQLNIFCCKKTKKKYDKINILNF